MAIDSAIKRASIASIGSFFVGPSVIPTGGFDQADRQHIGYGYSGILAGEAVEESMVVTAPRAAKRRYSSRPQQTYSRR